MKTPRRQLVKKYARAYLQKYHADLQPEDLTCLSAYLSFLKKFPFMQFFSYQAVLSKHEKVAIFMKAFSHINPQARKSFSHSIEQLIMVLVRHERLALLADIVALIAIRFFNAIGYQHATIYTSDTISEGEQKTITESFAALTHAQIDAEFKIDPTLIAGLKVISQDYVWESSISQKIKSLKV